MSQTVSDLNHGLRNEQGFFIDCKVQVIVIQPGFLEADMCSEPTSCPDHLKHLYVLGQTYISHVRTHQQHNGLSMKGPGCQDKKGGKLAL
jgi:hypothetical protein